MRRSGGGVRGDIYQMSRGGPSLRKWPGRQIEAKRSNRLDTEVCFQDHSGWVGSYALDRPILAQRAINEALCDRNTAWQSASDRCMPEAHVSLELALFPLDKHRSHGRSVTRRGVLESIVSIMTWSSNRGRMKLGVTSQFDSTKESALMCLFVV